VFAITIEGRLSSFHYNMLR